MTIERRFLGWERPALHLAADFLFSEFRQGSRWDMSSVAVALPGARAERRLRELLALRAAQIYEGDVRLILAPPRILTVGELPELFYKLSYRPSLAVATDLEVLVAWAEALRRMPPRALRQIFPAARESDPSSLFALASEAQALDTELASACVSCDDLQAYCSSKGQPSGSSRWRAFAEAQVLFRDALAEQGRISLNQARADSLQGPLKADRIVVITAGADLPQITRTLLARAQSRVVALVHAPESEAAGFDQTGHLDKSYWSRVTLDLAENGLEIVDFPRDQAAAIGRMVQSVGNVHVDMIAVGICEENLGAPVERAIEAAGKRAHRATGLRLSFSAPAQLLAQLAAYLSDRRAEHFAALIRHPDLNDWLVRKLNWPDSAGPWPDLCDEFIADRLPVAIDFETRAMPAELARAVQAIWDLAGRDQGTRQDLAACAERIGDILSQIYERDGPEVSLAPEMSDVWLAPPSLNEVSREGGRGVRSSAEARANPALDLLIAALGGLSLSAGSESLRLTLVEAVGFLLATCSDLSVPSDAGAPQIDLIGWLETHLDDSPILILAGFNEGVVPQSLLGDAFLPDSLRQDLGLLDNARRYARDAYLFRAILASRQIVRVVCGRYGAQNEPLAPSRLLLACSPDEVIHRILTFYGQDVSEAPAAPSSAMAYPLAAIPRPKRTGKPLTRLRVTAFRDYLACPYRFYLKHVLGLGAVEDAFVEMRPDAFGNLLHNVLQDFGRWVCEDKDGRPPVDPAEIKRFLRDSLEKRTKDRFGDSVRPAVAIQIELLWLRLEAFATFQAAEADSGWIILASERRLDGHLDVDGVPFGITGRIDRIDYHPGQDCYRILDYKSRDGGCDPEKSHRDSQGWTDLQLPLYRRLAGSIALGRKIGDAPVEVGYIGLPKERTKIGYVPAPWGEDEFRDACELAYEIIRKIRAEEFWPPRLDPPGFDDGYAAICLDNTLDRQAIIEQDSGAEAIWPERALAEEAALGA